MNQEMKDTVRYNAEVALSGLMTTVVYEATFLPDKARDEVSELLATSVPRICLGLCGGDFNEGTACIDRVRGMAETLWNKVLESVKDEKDKKDGDKAEDGADNES